MRSMREGPRRLQTKSWAGERVQMTKWNYTNLPKRRKLGKQLTTLPVDAFLLVRMSDHLAADNIVTSSMFICPHCSDGMLLFAIDHENDHFRFFMNCKDEHVMMITIPATLGMAAYLDVIVPVTPTMGDGLHLVMIQHPTT